MKSNLLIFLIAVGACLGSFSEMLAQGATTANISGTVYDESNELLPGATIVAVHQPTGSQYGNVTNVQGRFRLANMQVGGPYTVEVTFVGYEARTEENVFLTLGQTLNLTFDLAEQATQLEGVEILASQGDVFDGTRTGQQTVVDQQQINEIPTISRAIGDFARFNPLANISEGTDGFSISLAGQNNRYNAIYIDGAVNNDVFGLAGSGTNGGQTGVQPISIDAIEQFQINVAPFDVRQSGFAGGAINAVTRSGTNEFEGSAYYFERNENLAGTNPADDDNPLPEFRARTYGFRLGGPLVRNKLFFFANVELQRDETPQPFNFDTYRGNASRQEIQQLVDKVENDYGYDVGSFDNNTAFLDSDKILAKIDWNINQNHKLTLRHAYTRAENLEARNSNTESIGFINGSEFFISTTNSSALELKSNFGNNFSNKLVIGSTIVRDDRDPFGQPFPTVQIRDGDDGNIEFGAERFSTGNLLNQDIITVTNDFEWYKGNHTITIGTHNEYYDVGNLFIRSNFGRYRVDSLEQFLVEGTPVVGRYERSFSQVDNEIGDESSAIADFRTLQLGLYVQDEFQVTNNLRLTGGLRIDVPFFLDNQPENQDFINNTVPLIRQAGYDLQGATTGSFIDPQLLFSPRFGFNWDIKGDQSTQLRGGVGVFTSRLPLVWPGGAYNNYGFNIGEVELPNVSFNPDVNSQPPGEINTNNPNPSGQIDLFAEDFRLPQVLKVNVAVDQRLPGGLIGTVEGLFTSNINNVFYQNLNIRPSTATLAGTPDNRPIFDADLPRDLIDSTYTGIYLASNTGAGYSYNLVAQLSKPLTRGFSADVSYTYGDAFSVLEGTSSQNNSQWRGYQSVEGRNVERDPHRSDFSLGHRVLAQASYQISYLGGSMSSQLSVIYNGQSGRPFSYVYGVQNQAFVNDGGFDNSELIYIPAGREDIILVDATYRDGSTFTAEQQWEALNAFIENDRYLSDNRGGYAERNVARAPWEGAIDLRFLQNFNLGKNTLQLSVDIFNFSNLLNNEWGRIFSVPFDNYSLLDFEGFQSGTNVPTYRVDSNVMNGEDPWEGNIEDEGFRSSIWQMQLGLRYIFGN
ncbi:TonB-dependent receptor [Tunicatimonas pelagia]|uniref:TonB-dependent receptor n=1 Tax=Tunicatimonas pelagia TaxID=931531 RepID=UPI002666D5EE|nr:TonB-dependent receptor [Tunicatimonas pelagia]WKN42044.1 carboxypeptidase regulatory-like domain-containing protein [Tunicatimonas pelagia]